MKEVVLREVEKEDNKVYMITTKIKDLSKDDRVVTKTEILKTEVNEEILKEFETDRLEQFNNFKLQETQTKDKIKSITKQLKEYSSVRGYKAYKKNYQQYEIFEGFIENKVNVEMFLTGDSLKEFNKYQKKRDTYKNFYITMQQEMQIDMLKENLLAFEDIWEEDNDFIKQIKKARKLLK